MTLKIIPIEKLERKANEPVVVRQPQRAHRGTRLRIYRNGRERRPSLAPSDRERERFNHFRPDEVEQGFQVRFREER